MSIKEELHDLVEQLSDADAASILALLREQSANDADLDSPVPMSQRGGPFLIPGHLLFTTPTKTVKELAAEQRVKPFSGRESLPEDVFPDDEIDEFVRTVRQWRNEE